MARNDNIVLHTVDNTGSQAGVLTLVPTRARNGIFEYAGNNLAGSIDIITSAAFSRLSVSVRPGSPANFVSKVPRVKRRSTMKLALPVLVPGEEGNIVDYINLDVVLSSPVEANESQIRTALRSAELAAFDSLSSPLKDLVVNGREPF